MARTAAAPVPPRKTTRAKTARPQAEKKAPTTPSTARMVNTAIEDLKERNGSSLPAIKKYISATFRVDVVKRSRFIREYIVKAVAEGRLVRTKGTGANGYFKLPKEEEVGKKIATQPKSAAAQMPGTSKKLVKAKQPPKKSTSKETKPAKKSSSKVK